MTRLVDCKHCKAGYQYWSPTHPAQNVYGWMPLKPYDWTNRVFYRICPSCAGTMRHWRKNGSVPAVHSRAEA